MKVSNILSIVSVCLVIFSLVCIPFEVVSNRWLRILTSGIFFLFALPLFSFKNPLGLFSFLLFIFCDACLLFWEKSFSMSAYYFFHILIISFLIVLTIRELKWPKISKVEIISLIIFFLINTGILLFLGNSFNSEIDNLLLRILFYTNGFLILFLVLSAFFYSVHFANDVSAFFFLAIMALTVSDLLLFGILFLDLAEMKFIDNIFYTGGLYFLLISYLEHKKLKVPKATEVSQTQNRKEKKRNSGVYR